MLDSNPAATDALVRLMWGALVPGREGGLLNARLRYFDPARRRAGVPDDVAALVSELGDRRTVVTLVNLSATRVTRGRRPGRRLRKGTPGSDGRLTTRPRTTIAVDPPPSRLRASRAPSERISRAAFG